MNTKEEKVIFVSLALLVPSETNPRKDFKDAELGALKASISESGIQQPLIVRDNGSGSLEVVSGERRMRAAAELGLSELPVVVREMSDEQAVVWQLAENVMRDDLNPLEESEGVECLRRMGRSAEEISREVGMSLEWVQDRFDLGELPEVVKGAMRGGRLSAKGGQLFRKIELAEREKLAQEVLGFDEEVDDELLQELVRERYERPRKNRERWKDFGERGIDDFDFEGKCRLCDDPEVWAQYVLPYGEGVGNWKRSSDVVGGLAARREDERVSWGTLAAVHGVEGVLVPAGGVRDNFGNVVCVVDRSLIEAAERGSRQNGGVFVLGPRKAVVAAAAEKEETPPEEEEFEAGGEFSVSLVGEEVKVDRSEPWNPWIVEEEVEPTTEILIRAKAVELVLDEELMGWSARKPADVSMVSWVIFYVLRSGDGENAKLKKLAGLLGALELWLERGVK